MPGQWFLSRKTPEVFMAESPYFALWRLYSLCPANFSPVLLLGNARTPFPICVWEEGFPLNTAKLNVLQFNSIMMLSTHGEPQNSQVKCSVLQDCFHPTSAASRHQVHVVTCLCFRLTSCKSEVPMTFSLSLINLPEEPTKLKKLITH